MNDESIISRLEEWMESNTLYVPPDHLRRIMSNEKMRTVMTTVVNRARPKEFLKKAKCVLLCKKQMLPCGQKNNVGEHCKELELMRKRNKLKEQLTQKEEQFSMKKKEYIKLVKENQMLLQEIQWMHSILNEEKKKLLFLLLNEKALGDIVEGYSSLRQSVSEIKENGNRKTEKQSSSHPPDVPSREIMNECLMYIMNSQKRMEEQWESVQNIASEYECSSTNTFTADLKREIVKYVTKKLDNIPLCTISEILLEQQREIITSIQSLTQHSFVTSSQNCDDALDGSKMKELESIFFAIFAEGNDFGKIKSDSHVKHLEEENCSASEIQHCTVNTRIREELNLTETHLLDVEKCIAEKAIALKNLKINLKTNLVDITQRLSRIKQFCRRRQTSQSPQRETSLPAPQMEELYSSMQLLCELGPKEIQLFAAIPLVALEKLPLSDGKNVPVYKLLSSYQKVVSNTPRYSKSTFSVMEDSSGLSPYYLLLHVWEQLSYLEELQKAHCFMKPFVGTHIQLNVEPDEIGEKLEQMHEHFLGILSSFESKSDNISELLEIMRSHPLTAIVPKDLRMDGLSIQYFIDLFTKAKENEKSFCDTTQDCSGNILK